MFRNRAAQSRGAKCVDSLHVSERRSRAVAKQTGCPQQPLPCATQDDRPGAYCAASASAVQVFNDSEATACNIGACAAVADHNRLRGAFLLRCRYQVTQLDIALRVHQRKAPIIVARRAASAMLMSSNCPVALFDQHLNESSHPPPIPRRHIFQHFYAFRSHMINRFASNRPCWAFDGNNDERCDSCD